MRKGGGRGSLARLFCQGGKGAPRKKSPGPDMSHQPELTRGVLSIDRGKMHHFEKAKKLRSYWIS